MCFLYYCPIKSVLRNKEAQDRTSKSLTREWCRGEDLNLHELALTST